MLHRFAGIVAATAVVAAASFAGTAATAKTTGGERVPTYPEFKADTFTDHDGQYVVNGDEPVLEESELRGFYERMTRDKKNTGRAGDLIVNQSYGYDDLWSSSQVGNLTYCVSTSFGSDYSAVVSAMSSGAGQWEGASSAIDFVHVSSQDSSCSTSNNNVVFSVEPVSTTQYIARAFFPSYPKSSRNVLIDDSIWTSGSWSPSNILAHELGHVLGFRHEHTRPEAGTCFEDNNWRPLTAYDSSSIMHYPQCNGSSSDLSMTSTDRQGARVAYGS